MSTTHDDNATAGFDAFVASFGDRVACEFSTPP